MQIPVKGYRDHEESGKRETTKGTFSITDSKEMEIHKLSSKELKMIVLKMLRESQENTD